MEVVLRGDPKEIAALVVGLQERRREFVPEVPAGACSGKRAETGGVMSSF